jgi:DNA polymerase III epsilon subunit-like protein
MGKFMKTIISFDTETTGLLKPEACRVEDQPRIIEFAAIKYDETGKELDKLVKLIYPECDIPAVITKITGKTNKDFLDAPIFIEAYRSIADFFIGCDILTAHNLAFDRDMLANELIRIDKVLCFPYPPMQICTVKATMQLQGYRLSLTKLHQNLFNEDFKDAHSALADVRAQARCFFELVKRGVIVL